MRKVKVGTAVSNVKSAPFEDVDRWFLSANWEKCLKTREGSIADTACSCSSASLVQSSPKVNPKIQKGTTMET